MPFPVFSSSEFLFSILCKVLLSPSPPFQADLFCMPMLPIEAISLKCHSSPTPPTQKLPFLPILGFRPHCLKTFSALPDLEQPRFAPASPVSCQFSLPCTLTHCAWFSSCREQGERKGGLDRLGLRLISITYCLCTFGHLSLNCRNFICNMRIIIL